MEQSIADLQAEIDNIDEQNTKADKFLQLTQRYTDFTELTTPMLHEFIEKVVVHERVRGGRYGNSQQIDVYFNFVGMVELPKSIITDQTISDVGNENVNADNTNATNTSSVPTTKEPPKQLYVAKGSSFEVLGEYLRQTNTETITLTYSQIEEILDKPLCKSAYKFYSYWSPSHNRPAGNVIYNAGYDVVKVDIKGQMIYLRKPDMVI